MGGDRTFNLGLPRELHDKRMSQELRDHLWMRFDETLDKGLAFQKRYCTEPIATVPIQVTRSMCNIIQILYLRAVSSATDKHGDNGAKHPSSNEKLVDKLYAFAYVWSVGGSIGGGPDDHDKFEDFCGDVLDHVNFGRDGVFGGFVETTED